MSLEWVASNEPGRRIRIYADELIQRFDKLSGSTVYRLQNCLVIYEDGLEGTRTNIVSQEAIVFEDERYVYIRMRGQRVIRREPFSTPYSTRRSRVGTERERRGILVE